MAYEPGSGFYSHAFNTEQETNRASESLTFHSTPKTLKCELSPGPFPATPAGWTLWWPLR